jgi:hypothetical protein
MPSAKSRKRKEVEAREVQPSSSSESGSESGSDSGSDDAKQRQEIMQAVLVKNGLQKPKVATQKQNKKQKLNSGEPSSSSSSSSSSPTEASAPAEDKPPVNLTSYINKQRTLVFCNRGVTHRDRHFMNDLRDLLPHSKPVSVL